MRTKILCLLAMCLACQPVQASQDYRIIYGQPTAVQEISNSFWGMFGYPSRRPIKGIVYDNPTVWQRITSRWVTVPLFCFCLFRLKKRYDKEFLENASRASVSSNASTVDSDDPVGLSRIPSINPQDKGTEKMEFPVFFSWLRGQTEKENERKFRRRMSDEIDQIQLEQIRQAHATAHAQHRRSFECEDIPDMPARREVRHVERRVPIQPSQMPEWQKELMEYFHDGGDPCVEVEGERMPIVNIMWQLHNCYLQRSLIDTQRASLYAQKVSYNETWFDFSGRGRELQTQSVELDNQLAALDTQYNGLSTKYHALAYKFPEFETIAEKMRKKKNALHTQYSALGRVGIIAQGATFCKEYSRQCNPTLLIYAVLDCKNLQEGSEYYADWQRGLQKFPTSIRRARQATICPICLVASVLAYPVC